MMLLMLMIPHAAQAQCTYENRAQIGNETINYTLYFNWKFIWLKVGTATMVTKTQKYQGQDAYFTRLVTRTSEKYDEYFRMRDTLISYYSPQLTPLYYRKGAFEGKRYYVDEMWYSYPKGKCQVKIRHYNSKSGVKTRTSTYADCVSDMLHSFQRFRNLSSEGWQKGKAIYIDIAGGRDVVKAKLVYKGTETVKADNGKKYKCLVISYQEKEDGKDKEIVRFFVTNDARHVPIRLDLHLKFGTAKAFLT